MSLLLLLLLVAADEEAAAGHKVGCLVPVRGGSLLRPLPPLVLLLPV
jgi:hypothetical protein